MLQAPQISIAVLTYFGFLVALTMHEAAHAFMARFLGDKSPETAHRATINPLPHIDLWGTVIFPLVMILYPARLPIVFGWAKPTQINPTYFRHVRRDTILTSLAGPGANFLIAALCGVALRLMGPLGSLFNIQMWNIEASPVQALLGYTAISNIVIGTLNFLPFPGADGWRILVNTVKYPLAQKLEQSSSIIGIVMLGLLLLGFLSPIIAGTLYLFGFVFGLA